LKENGHHKFFSELLDMLRLLFPLPHVFLHTYADITGKLQVIYNLYSSN